ncbi:MAG: response regulator transcription factor [Candidatus Eisenbacteria bacterium]
MSVPKHVLVAESDEQTRVHLAGAFRASGYATTESATGRDALRSIQIERPDVVIVGVTLPDIGGRDLARILASNGDHEPICTIVAAESGAPEEDVSLPGAPEIEVAHWSHVDELVTLVNEMFDVSEGQDPERFRSAITCGDVKIDPNTWSVEVNGVPVDLTRKEFHFLHVLAVNKERTCTREELRRLVWGGSTDVIGRTVDVLVSRLRSKLTAATGREVVSTVRGIGYRFMG